MLVYWRVSGISNSKKQKLKQIVKQYTHLEAWQPWRHHPLEDDEDDQNNRTFQLHQLGMRDLAFKDLWGYLFGYDFKSHFNPAVVARQWKKWTMCRCIPYWKRGKFRCHVRCTEGYQEKVSCMWWPTLCHRKPWSQIWVQFLRHLVDTTLGLYMYVYIH